MALEDLRVAADPFGAIYDATAGRDGWVSLEVSLLLAGKLERRVKPDGLGGDRSQPFPHALARR